MTDAIRLAAVGVCYALPDGRSILEGLDLEVPTGRLGLVGRNGSGKSTLLDLLSGSRSPTGGRVVRTGRIAVLSQAPPRQDAGSVAHLLGVAERLEAVRRLEGGDYDDDLVDVICDDWEVESRARLLLSRLGLGHLSLDRPLHSLSGGEARRVALAGAMLAEPDYLLLDEPTNHLDIDARARLTEVLGAWQRGLVVVSHDRRLLDHMGHIAHLRDGRVHLYGGNYSHFEACRAAEVAAARRAMERAELELKRARRQAREEADKHARKAARGVRSRSTGSQPKMVLNVKKAASERSGARLKHRTDAELAQREARLQHARAGLADDGSVRVDLGGTRVPAGKVVLEATDLTWTAPDGSFTLGPLDLLVQGPGRIGIVGANGSGKSTLLRLLLGTLAPTAGRVRRAPLRWALLDQHTEMLRADVSLLANLQHACPDLGISEARWWLDRFLFSRFEVDKPAGVLSGGERMRAALACILAGAVPPQVLVLDEPTNDLDLDTVGVVARALRDFEGALLLVTHDLHFLDDLGVARRLRLVRSGREALVDRTD